MDYKKAALEVLQNVGGEENVISIMSCFTRVRVEVKDKDKVNDAQIKKIEGCQGLNWASNTIQIIFGGKCNDVYDELEKIVHISDSGEEEATAVVKKKKSVGAVIIDYIANSIQPIVPILIASGFIQSLLAMLNYINIDTTTYTYQVLYAIGQAGYYFLPIFLAFAAAKKLCVKQDLKRLKDYLSNRLYKSGAKVHLNTRMDPQKIRELNADSIILALGAYPVTFQISGMEKNQIMTAIDAYKNLEKTGKNVVIIGGGSIGCELGVDLAKMGRKVTILELGPVLNRTLNDIMKVALKTEMDKCKNLTAITETSCKEIREHSVITEMEDGSQKEILADTVIFAAGMRARLDEANEYFGIVQDTNIIGDANRVGTVWSALEDGYYISAHL